MEVTSFSQFDMGISHNDPKLVYLGSTEMNRQQTYWESMNERYVHIQLFPLNPFYP